MNIAEIFYGVLVKPVETFKEVSYEKPYKLPLFVVIVAALFLMILSENTFSFASLMAFSSKLFNLIVYWLFFAFFVDLMSIIFNNHSNYTKLLTLTGLSFIPWIFLAPLRLLKHFSDFGSTIAMLLILFIWGWTIGLQIIAISETYDISRKKAIIVLFIPFLGAILYLVWIIDFFVKLFQISAL